MFDKKKIINIAIIGGFLVVVIILISILVVLLRKNPYGEQIKIDNFGMVNISQDGKDLVMYQLYNIVLNNVEEGVEIPQSGAIIREQSYQSEDNGRVGRFLVDIEEIRESYLVQYDLSDEGGGYPILILCPEEKDRIYKEQKCQNLIELGFVNVTWKNDYQLRYSVGNATAARVLMILEDNITSALNNPQNNTNVKATIDEVSMRKYNEVSSGVAYAFSVDVDGVMMDVIVRCDESYGAEYIAVYAKYGEQKYATIVGDDIVESYSSIVNWLAEISGLKIEEVVIKN